MGPKSIFLLFSLAILVDAEILKYDFVLKNSADDNHINKLDDDWWRTAIIYQIYPLSFMDSNGDGIGDLQGIISKLDHLKDMGVDALWLSPIYKSPGVDQGYDISDYRDIDPIYGNLDDLKILIVQAHSLGLKVLMDFVPDYTSDQHDWFQQSIKRNGIYTDFYIWAGNDSTQLPNNWLSEFGGSAWEWNEQRMQFYYHVFTPGQPDLNYSNPDVIKEMKANMKFWLDLNIDGFRVDAVSWLFEASHLKDEPLSGLPGVDSTSADYLKHIYTTNLDATYDMIYQFREVLDEYNQNVNYSRIMMTEAYGETAESVARYYGNSTTAGAQFTFNFNLISDLDSSFTVDDIIRIVNKWFSHLGENYVSNWVLGNHDRHRVASRLGAENVDAFNMLTAFLPGVQVTYMGEEIGMENGAVTCEQGWDPRAIKNCSTFQQNTRDLERTPFQWDDTANAGFSTNKLTWLPVSDNYKTTNLKAQNITSQNSHYKVYKNMVQFRHNFKNITYDAVSLIKLNDNGLQIIRKTNLAEHVYLLNTANTKQTVNIFGIGEFYAVSVPSIRSQNGVGDVLKNPIMLQPHESIVLTALIAP